ncbi:MAG: nicotinate-nucleotide--dimethylbenzimidazole phosphoribosyltransferase [Helicobacteraceae bacterium]|nr:nicotinate-nucleotide--dimethylbenzimidazole phosphoribosyltransferase [Candidatus Sulfurimonas ponti]
MKTLNIFTQQEDATPQGRADFLLASGVTRTCEIDGITQAKTPKNIPLIPTLDGEYIVNEKVFSHEELLQTLGGVPSPALITRAVHNLNPFSSIELLDLGLEVKPQNAYLHSFGINPSSCIATGADIDAKEIFRKGMTFGKNYELKGNHLILGQSIPAGTITAAASCLALGYACKNDFSLGFANEPSSVQAETVRQAIRLTNQKMSNFEKLSIVSDNMLLFCAGFLLEASRRFHVVLAGGTQMAACLLIADKLREDVLMQLKSENITLATTSWVVNDSSSDIKHLLSLLSYTPHAVYTDFSFANTEIEILKKYDEGEAKEGVGAGASLAYGLTNGLNNKQILNEIEILIYSI